MKVARSSILGLLSLAALTGILAQDLLMAPTMGLNLAILCVVSSVGIDILCRTGRLGLSTTKWYIHGPLWIAAFGFAFSASVGTDELNLILLASVVGWVGLRGMKNQVLSLAQSILLGPVTALIAPLLPFFLPNMTDWSSPSGKKLKLSKGAITGAGLALPVLLVFGAILS